MKLLRPLTDLSRSSASFLLAGFDHAQAYGRTVHALVVGIFPAVFLLRSTRDELYNVLWALVFAFATLNILSLGARHFESDRRGLTFGEILAILVVLVSVVMLGWEMLYVFRIFPLHLAPR
jgi:hypothetical protein